MSQLRHMRSKTHEIRMDLSLSVGYLEDIIHWAHFTGFSMDLVERAQKGNIDSLQGVACLERCMMNMGGQLPGL